MKGKSSLPYLGQIELSKIDLVLITHFHLDHCGALPWLLEKVNLATTLYKYFIFLNSHLLFMIMFMYVSLPVSCLKRNSLEYIQWTCLHDSCNQSHLSLDS